MLKWFSFDVVVSDSVFLFQIPFFIGVRVSDSRVLTVFFSRGCDLFWGLERSVPGIFYIIVSFANSIFSVLFLPLFPQSVYLLFHSFTPSIMVMSIWFFSFVLTRSVSR